MCVTGSRSSYKVLKNGIRLKRIGTVPKYIKWLDKQTIEQLYVMRGFTGPWSGAKVERRLGQSTSTDEQGVDRAELQEVFKRFRVQATVDAMASSRNRICEKFVSKYLPTAGCYTSGFFVEPGEVYFCCPLVSEARHVINKLRGKDKVEAVLVL